MPVSAISKLHAIITAVILVAAPNLQADWVADGVAVIAVIGAQDMPVTVSDAAGGAFVAWRDYRTANTDIYAQRVDDDGNLLWTLTGMPVCVANNAQSLPLMVPDGAGGAIVVWQDFRSNNVLDIYAQRINSLGYGQWTANGVAVCTGVIGLALSQIVDDGSGGAIITWHDRRNATNDVFAQRIDGSGVVQWTANGAIICAATGSQISPSLASDGAGGVIISWTDNRGGLNDIYAQRVDAAGAVQWAADGIAVCGASQYQTLSQVVSDGAGGAIISWSDHRNAVDYDVYAQRLDGSGAALWTANGVAVSAYTGNQQNCRLVPIGSGESIIAWTDYRSGNSDVYAQRMNASGVGQWTANGVPISAAANNQITIQLILDVSGGAIAVWEDGRVSASDYNLYAQKINSNGTVAWTTDGVALCTATGNQSTVALAPDGYGGAFAAWKDERGGNADVYTQRVDAAGHTIVATLLQSYAASVSGGAIEIKWTLSEADVDIDFFVLRAEVPSAAFVEISSSAIERNGLSFSWIDKDCAPGETYRYRVDVFGGRERMVLFETGSVTMPPMPTFLYQNVPNPFNPSTTIKYFVPERCRVALEIFDVSGNVVCRLTAGDRERGLHSVTWDGRDDTGSALSTGVYYCRLKAGRETFSRAMVLLR